MTIMITGKRFDPRHLSRIELPCQPACCTCALADSNELRTLMSTPFVVTFENKSYTWEGGRWYGTLDYVKPSLGMIHKLNTLIPAVPIKKSKRARVKVV